MITDLKLGLTADWMRTDLARGLELKEGKPVVDREQRIIHGFAVVSKGEAKGHGVLIDDTFLNQVLLQGQTSKAGIKMRFDHPNASNTSIGTALGRAKNFRRDGDVIRADAHILEAAMSAPNGNLGGYVMDLAEQDPGLFGASIAFKPAEAEWQRDKDGKADKSKPPFARLKQLLATDIVDDPAANPEGLFGQDSSLAAKATAFLNRWMEHDLMPVLLTQFKEALMSEQKQEAENNILLDEEKSRIKWEATKAERKRVKDINAAFTAVWGSEQVESIEYKHRDELIDLGVSIEDAEKEFRVRKLRQMSAEAPKSAGGGHDEPIKEKVDLSKLPPAERYKAEWDASPEIQEEFGGNFEPYAAYRKAEDEGRIGADLKKHGAAA